MARGRKTGGRRPGTPNKKTVSKRAALANAAAEMNERLAEDASYVPTPQVELFKGDAHALLRMVYKDPRYPMETRIDCAKSAIRFERPALSAAHVAHSNAPSREVLASLTTDQLRQLLQDMDAEQPPLEGAVIDLGLALPAPEPIERDGDED